MTRIQPLLALALIAACGRADAQPSPADRTFDALDGVVRGSSLYLVDSDGTTLRAIALETATVRFTVTLGPRESEALIHDLGEGRLLVQTPHRFVTIDSASGEIVATRESTPGWKFVWRAAGACALRSECTFEPIDGRTGAPIGPALRGTYMHRYAIDVGHGTDNRPSCQTDFDVLGRAANASLFLAGPLNAPIETTTREVIAIDDAGAIKWHRADLGCSACTRLGAGVSTDGSICWTSESAAETTMTMTAFDCASGRVRFRNRLERPSPYRDPEMLAGWVPGRGLLVLEATRARLFTPGGRMLWSRSTPRDVVLLPEGAVFPSYALELPELRSIEHVDDARGTTVRTELAEGRVIRIGHDGRPRFVPNESGTDRGGGEANPISRFTFERASSGSRALADGRPMLAIPGDGWALGEHVTAEGGAVLAVTERREGRPDRVHLVRVGRAP